MNPIWPFKRKKTRRASSPSGPRCTFCGSTDTRLMIYHGGDSPDYIRVWRGERLLTCRCNSCGQDFYVPETQVEITDVERAENRVIDDEEALRAAEEELKRQIDKDNDRIYR